uniref:Uncharacterized protein n=1 Tax=viral metagenome TaxID=1070528 RepID=A0A6M3KFR3_9ZZZZ
MIDLEELRQEIKGLTRRKKLFQVLKTELSALGYWRNRPRGDSIKAKQASDKAKGVV